MKVLFFTKYSRKGASSRLRTFQYLDFLTSNGVECTVNSFFSDQYLDQLYKNKKHNKWLAFKSFVLRMRALLSVFRFDKVVIEKELFPYFPSVAERFLFWSGVKYIVDYDDAIFHNYDISPNRLVRFFLGSKIRNVMRFAGTVVVGNEYLKSKALEFGSRKVVLIPTVIDIEKYKVRETSPEKPFTIGWIGSPITFKYILPFKELFVELASRHEIRLKFIGVTRGLGIGPVEELVPWSEDSEVAHIETFDVGIMPLEDNIWERGKCGYKLIQYMGCGIPVIGTPIGVNDHLLEDFVNGFKASTTDDWRSRLTYIIQNSKDQNIAMGRNGRKLVEEKYSLQVFRKTWLLLLTQSEQI